MDVVNESAAADGEALSSSLDAMRLDNSSRINLSDLPDDLLEMIASACSDLCEDGWGRGGMDDLWLVSKRLMRVVESCATQLSLFSDPLSDPESLPIH